MAVMRATVVGVVGLLTPLLDCGGCGAGAGLHQPSWAPTLRGSRASPNSTADSWRTAVRQRHSSHQHSNATAWSTGWEQHLLSAVGLSNTHSCEHGPRTHVWPHSTCTWLCGCSEHCTGSQRVIISGPGPRAACSASIRCASASRRASCTSLPPCAGARAWVGHASGCSHCDGWRHSPRPTPTECRIARPPDSCTILVCGHTTTYKQFTPAYTPPWSALLHTRRCGGNHPPAHKACCHHAHALLLPPRLINCHSYPSVTA
jgi:hypothetical protein